MKSMFDHHSVDSLKLRISELDSATSPKWGSFTAPKMVCHLIDQMEYALSTEAGTCTLEKGPPMIIRHAIRTVLPWPKSAPTAEEMLVSLPETWDADIEKLKGLMDTFSNAEPERSWPFHPFFGQLNGAQWAKLTWRHTDFHLKQFGC